MFLLLLAGVVALLLLYMLIDCNKPASFPPGPDWVPILGNWLLFTRLYKKFGFVHLVWENLSKTYGPLIGVRLGTSKVVIGTGLSVIKELLTKEPCDGRPDGFFFRYRALGGRYGIVFVDGDFFYEQKRFVMKHLRSFGFNTSIMENRINVETADFVQKVLKAPGGVIRLPEDLEVSVMNVTWAMIAGERWALDDPASRELFTLIHASLRIADMSGGILNQMPFLRFIMPEFSSFNKLNTVLNNLESFVTKLVDKHRRSVSPYENRDLIDAFLNEMKRRQGEKNTTFTDKQLLVLIMDLMLAGAETVSSTLVFCLLYLIHYPQVQRNIQEEMEAAVGKNKQPFLEHRQKLVYLEAFMMEVQRISNVTATTVSHRAKENTEVQGYIIPKDAIIICNLYSVHMNREYWVDPEAFRPERFLNEKREIIQHDYFIPFGLGRRRCMGEALARSSVYLFLTAILHNFVVSGTPEVPLPPIRSHDGATIIPAPYTAVFTPRNQTSPQYQMQQK